MRRSLQLVAVLFVAQLVLAQQSALLDRVVVTVDRQVIMASDVEGEARLAKLLAGTPDAAITTEDRKAAFDRLLTTKLVLPRVRSEYMVSADAPEVTKQLEQVRTTSKLSPPEWQALLTRLDLSENGIAERLSEELTLARYIDMRFRSTVIVPSEDIESYYNGTFVPQMKERGAAAPQLKQVSQQIEQVLVEQKVNELFGTWVDSLRTQARIRSLDPAYPVDVTKRAAPQDDPRYLPLRISAAPASAPSAAGVAKTVAPTPEPEARSRR